MIEAIEGQTPKEWLAKRESQEMQAAIERRLATPNAHPGAEISLHAHVTDCLIDGRTSTFCSCHHCTLAVCSRCGAYEGGLTTHCPGERVDLDTTQAIYTTTLDYLTDRGWHMSDTGMQMRSPRFAAEQNGAAR